MSEHLLGGRYRLESELGHGGMATVWRGVDARLDRPVAVKVLERAALTVDPAAQERFNREAWTIARLTNVHVVRVYDVGVDGGRAFLVMELVEGTNLAALLASGRLDPKRAVDIAAQVCDALSAAHAVGVVHRDIKPGNILIDHAGTVKLCDFGIARLVGVSHATLTRAGTTIGTSQYMAPEQVSGDPIDARTDLYALGCVLYAMLAGAPPFQGDAPLGIAHQQLTRQPDPIATRRPGLPAPLASLVGRLLAKNPADRPQTAAEVRAELESMDWSAGPAAAPTVVAAAARASAPVVSPTRTMPVLDESYLPDGPGPRKRWPLAAAAVVAVVVAAVIVAVLLANRPDPNGDSQAGGSPAATATTAPDTTTGRTTDSSPAGGDQAADPVDALRQVITEQAAAGNVDQDAADDIDGKLDDLQQAVQDGKNRKIAEAGRELVQKLAEARRDGKINDTAWSAIEPVATQLSASLPSGDGNQGKGGDD